MIRENKGISGSRKTDAALASAPHVPEPRSLESVGNRKGSKIRRRAAFTRLDLLAVVSLVAVFSVSLPAGHSSTQSTSAMIVCMRNVRSLIEGWAGYADDHQGVLPASNQPSDPDVAASPWAGGGWMDMPSTARNGVDPYHSDHSISQGAIWEYAGSDPTIWRCPSDPSTGSHPDYMGG